MVKGEAVTIQSVYRASHHSKHYRKIVAARDIQVTWGFAHRRTDQGVQIGLADKSWGHARALLGQFRGPGGTAHSSIAP